MVVVGMHGVISVDDVAVEVEVGVVIVLVVLVAEVVVGFMIDVSAFVALVVGPVFCCFC